MEVYRRFPHPTKNEYFEDCSADGWAFLGRWKHKNGLDYTDCLEAIRRLNYSIPVAKYIKSHKVTKDVKYIYTRYECFRFLLEIGNIDEAKQLFDECRDIGRYRSGAVRYCNDEIFYEVPNVTPMMAHMYFLMGEEDNARELIEWLKRNMDDGNWWYWQLDESLERVKRRGREDSNHLCMIYETVKDIDADLANTIEESIVKLNKNTGRCM